MALRRVVVAPALCAALSGLGGRRGVVPLWLTSWLPETRRAMRPPFPGRDWEQIEVDGDPRGGWPKWSALDAWLTRHPQVTRLAWIDDDLAQPVAPHRPNGPTPCPHRHRGATPPRPRPPHPRPGTGARHRPAPHLAARRLAEHHPPRRATAAHGGGQGPRTTTAPKPARMTTPDAEAGVRRAEPAARWGEGDARRTWQRSEAERRPAGATVRTTADPGNPQNLRSTVRCRRRPGHPGTPPRAAARPRRAPGPRSW